MASLQTLSLLLFLGLAATWDVRTRCVPNWLVAAFGTLAFVLAAGSCGLGGLQQAGLGSAVGLGSLLLPFALGFVGAGDVKFMGTAGAFLGAEGVVYAFLLGSVLGAPMALAALRRARRPAAPAGPPPGVGTGQFIPYALPLALGCAAAVALHPLVGCSS